MNKQININASVVSHIGIRCSDNEDNFYINGRYMHEYERKDIQVSIENSGEEYIFAVCSGMDRTSSEKNASISMVKELKKFQEKIKGTGGDLQSKLGQMKERIGEVNNVIYSMNIGKHTEISTSFAGIIVLDGQIAAVSLGRSKVYQLRDNNMKLIAADGKKTERLLKMGIITDGQAKALSGNSLSINSDGNSRLNKSDTLHVKPGDIFLICSEGICSILDDENIREVLSSNKDTGYIANMIVSEAMKKGCEENATALAVRIEDSDGSAGFTNKKAPARTDNRHRSPAPVNERRKNINTVVASVIACIVILGILTAVFYKTWLINGNEDSMAENPATVQSTTARNVDISNTDKTDASTSVEAITQEQQNINPTGQSNSEQEEVAKKGTNSETTDETAEIEHIVKAGENLSVISKKYYGTAGRYGDIMKRNGMSNPDQLKVGDVLKIPK